MERDEQERRRHTRHKAMRSTAEIWTGSHLFGATASLVASFVPTPRMCRGISLRIINDRFGFGCVRNRTRRRYRGDTPITASAAAETSAGESIRTGGGGDSGSSGGAFGHIRQAERADNSLSLIHI